MKKMLLPAVIAGYALIPLASAGTYEWTSGWAQGVTEYQTDDGNGNELIISCSNDLTQPVVAFARIGENQYSSAEDPGFDVIVDGVTFSNPFFTNCRSCNDEFPAFWRALRKANKLQVSDEHKTINLSSKNLPSTIPPLDSSQNSCRSAWQ